MASRFVLSGQQIFTGPGKPASLGKINFWGNGGTTNQDTFPTAALTGANANPVILSSTGRVPEIWANNSDVFAVRILEADNSVIVSTVQDISFLSDFSLSAAQVLAVLNGNSAAVVIDGASMGGDSFANFLTALTLTAAGTIDASAGAITLGTVTGTTTDTGHVLNSPVLKGTLSGNAFLDEDDMASDSAVKVSSQQATKAYIDAQVAGAGLQLDSTTPRTSLFTAVVGKWYLINTTAGSFNITMPNSPSADNAIGLMDYAGTFAANPPDLVQAASADNIFRANEDGKISINNFSGALVMTDATDGWMNRGF